ncbi:MAG: class I SAM-dependent methyltransferase [Candidatus Izemoplasmatales bacterium]|nr:class I SAM-dependent methyltransferase [Candidatus Izemoplasmatales bacterium]
MKKKDPYQNKTERYEKWYQEYSELFNSEIQAIKQVLPRFQRGVEIGVGTGMFASHLGILEGVEPSMDMAKIAKLRKIHVYQGVAEKLPLENDCVDLALMVTADCFLNDIEQALREIWRILRSQGHFIIGFIDRDTFLGRQYEQKKATSDFYKNAQFHSTKEMLEYLDNGGFFYEATRQTVFSYENTYQEPIPGSGRGGFVVIRAKKT